MSRLRDTSRAKGTRNKDLPDTGRRLGTRLLIFASYEPLSRDVKGTRTCPFAKKKDACKIGSGHSVVLKTPG